MCICRAARVLIFGVLDNANDFVIAAVTHIRHSEVLADRILVRKNPARERFVDDSNI